MRSHRTVRGPSPGPPTTACCRLMLQAHVAGSCHHAITVSVSLAAPCAGSAQIKQLMEMGFDEERCKEALQKANGDVNVALESLFG